MLGWRDNTITSWSFSLWKLRAVDRNGSLGWTHGSTARNISILCSSLAWYCNECWYEGSCLEIQYSVSSLYIWKGVSERSSVSPCSLGGGEDYLAHVDVEMGDLYWRWHSCPDSPGFLTAEHLMSEKQNSL